jgi:hypothetical protein
MTGMNNIERYNAWLNSSVRLRVAIRMGIYKI